MANKNQFKDKIATVVGMQAKDLRYYREVPKQQKIEFTLENSSLFYDDLTNLMLACGAKNVYLEPRGYEDDYMTEYWFEIELLEVPFE